MMNNHCHKKPIWPVGLLDKYIARLSPQRLHRHNFQSAQAR
jgi:hypothetical protein